MFFYPACTCLNDIRSNTKPDPGVALLMLPLKDGAWTARGITQPTSSLVLWPAAIPVGASTLAMDWKTPRGIR
jgi:hypothetical protein